MDGDCPETLLEWVVLMGSKIFTQEGEKSDFGRVEVAISDVRLGKIFAILHGAVRGERSRIAESDLGHS